MSAIGKVKFRTDRHSYYFSHNERVEIDTEDLNKIPDDCLSYKDPTPNKTAIRTIAAGTRMLNRILLLSALSIVCLHFLIIIYQMI